MKSSFDSSGSPRGIGSLVLGGAGVVLLLLGVVFVLVGGADYTDYTGRADAVVVERDVDHRRSPNGNRRSEVDVYVSYRTEDGTQVEHAELGGLNPSEHEEGERLQIAYHPDRPGDPVTVRSTEEGAFHVFRVLGAVLAAVGAGLVVWAAVPFLRSRFS